MAPIKAREAVSAADVHDMIPEALPHVQPGSLQDVLRDSTQALPGTVSPQEEDWALWFDCAWGGQGSHLGGHGGAWRPHVEIAIHWFPMNLQYTLVLVDTGAEYSLI